LEASQANGLKLRSQVMADKPVTVHRKRVGSRIGRLEDEDIQKLNSILTFVMGLSD
jgi:mRNA interferase MazF